MVRLSRDFTPSCEIGIGWLKANTQGLNQWIEPYMACLSYKLCELMSLGCDALFEIVCAPRLR